MTTYKGWEAKIEVEAADGCDQNNPLTFVESFNFTQDDGIEAVYQIGSRSAQEIKEGPIRTTGTITRQFDPAWKGGTGSTQAFYTIAGLGDTDAHTAYDIALYPAGYDSASLVKITFNDVKFSGYNVSVSEGVTKESVNFTALTTTVGVTS